MKKEKERRREKRVRVAVPVWIGQKSGITRDISQSGFYFLTDQKLTPGVDFRFALELDYIFPGEPVYIDCIAKVLRIEPSGDKLGVAASISEFCGVA
jgi:hypothetical protein